MQLSLFIELNTILNYRYLSKDIERLENEKSKKFDLNIKVILYIK